MSLFRCNIDRAMVNTGTKVKPFISAQNEAKEYYCGPIKYCTIRTSKEMENIGDDIRPWYVKVYELVTVRFLGIQIRNKEQSWKFEKL